MITIENNYDCFAELWRQLERTSREFLRALVAVRLGIGIRKVDLKALDRAYSEVFPYSTPINVNKKKREPP